MKDGMCTQECIAQTKSIGRLASWLAAGHYVVGGREFRYSSREFDVGFNGAGGGAGMYGIWPVGVSFRFVLLALVLKS